MALKVFDGYDHYNTATDWRTRSGWLQYQQPSTNTTPIAFPTGRDGYGKCIQFQQSVTENYFVFGDRNQEGFLGFALQQQTAGCGTIIRLYDSVTELVNLYILMDPVNYAVVVYRGPPGDSGYALLGYSANNVWFGNTWNFFEVGWNISGSGSIEVRINNVTVMNLTGVNTNYTRTSPTILTANAWVDMMSIKGTNGAYLVDDFYYCDTVAGAGTYPCNTFLGDVKVDTLFAIGNNAVQWTPLTGSNYQMIDETAMDSDTSYNYSATTGQEDTFNFSALESKVITVLGVQLTGAWKKDDAGSRVIKQALKSGATEVYGADHSIPSTTYAYFTDIWVVNPDTSLSWTVTDLNSIIAGYNLVS